MCIKIQIQTRNAKFRTKTKIVMIGIVIACVAQ